MASEDSEVGAVASRRRPERPGPPAAERTEDGAREVASAPAEGYRPHLDGLRALAVYLVVAFHTGSHRLQGGFIGVDVFFVLSGFLVTRSLLHDVGADGSVRIGRFYFRRVRRLLPAAAVNLVVTAVVFAWIATPRELLAAQSSVRAAALWYANWHFIDVGADYFGPSIASSPVAHYWSLSVEEQIYLAWPLVLLAILAVTRRAGWRPRRAVGAVAAAGAVASLAAALLIARTDLDRAYYGTDTRAYQVLIGACLAVAPGLLRRAAADPRMRRVASVAGLPLLAALVVVASSTIDVGPITRGAGAAAIALALIATFEVAPASGGARFLAIGPLVALGRISYGTYLWHWIVVLVLEATVELGDVAMFLVTATVATALASLSMELIERPIRTASAPVRHWRASIAVGLAVSVLIGVVIAPRVLDPSRAEGSTRAVLAEPDTPAAGPEGTVNDVDLAALLTEAGATLARCVGQDPVCPVRDGGAGTVLVVGDSTAAAFTETFDVVAEAHDLRLLTFWKAACPWVQGLSFPEAEGCAEQQAELADVITEVDPDLVVLVHRPILDPANPVPLFDASGAPVADDAREDLVLARTRESLDAVRALGPEVLVVEPTPVSRRGFDPTECLATATVLEECRDVAAATPTAQEVLIREIAEADDGLWALDLDPAVCPYLPICDPVVGGEVVKMDDTHLTSGFARALGPRVDEFLVSSTIVG